MEKPQGYDEAQAYTGERETLEPGGYICKIIGAKEEITKTGSKQLIVAFDIVEGERAGFYKRRHSSLIIKDATAKWPGVYRQFTEGKSTSFYKGFNTSIEKSNPGYVWNWDEKTLAGKLFGGVFGREEYWNTAVGDYRFTVKCVSVRSVDTIRSGEFEIPKDKLADRTQSAGGATPGGVQSSYLTDEELPF